MVMTGMMSSQHSDLKSQRSLLVVALIYGCSECFRGVSFC